jgi:fructosamine-3-kinase
MSTAEVTHQLTHHDELKIPNATLPPAEYDLNGFLIDLNVLLKFPKGTKIVSAGTFGASAWTSTSRIHIQHPGGQELYFFLKTASGDEGKTLVEGEYSIMSELNRWAPDFVPQPHSWGRCAQSNPVSWFMLIEYVDMRSKMPSPFQLCSKLARLHRESQSPTGMFGFHTATCQGRTPQSVGWDSNWTSFFTKLIQHVMKLDFESNGYWEELDKVEQRLVSHVIPRLLDALVSGGRTLKPSLIHGDLWEGNTGTAYSNGNVYVFDSAGFYAHNEMDTGNWRGYYNKISNKVYTRTYLRHSTPSEPKAEWIDRNRLYSTYYNIIYSVNHLTQGTAVRQL